MINIDPTKISQEVKDKYSIVNNSFRLTAKSDPKDRITVEIGDVKQAEFYPQVKIGRWGNSENDNEVNCSIRLKDTEIGTEKVSTLKEKIIWEKGNLSVEYYEADNGYKFVWYLKEKPLTNKVEFTIQSKGLDFFYQPEILAENETNLSRVLDTILKENPQTVLDFGGGTGELAKQLIENGVDATVVDISQEAYDNRVVDKFILGDIFDVLPTMADNSFDLIVDVGVLKYIDKDRADELVSEIKRVSKKSIHFLGAGSWNPSDVDYLEKESNYTFWSDKFLQGTDDADLYKLVLKYRPDNVVGSYAVYHSTKGGMNDINGMEYKVGKFGHIYRPHIYDSDGKECWGNLHIENGIYSVEIPQDFLDKAVYPIKSNDTFGNDHKGATYNGVHADNILGSVFTGVAGTVDSITMAFTMGTFTSGNKKCAIYKESDSSKVCESEERYFQFNETDQFLTFTVSGSPAITAIDYVLVGWSDSSFCFYYDSGTTNQGQQDPQTYGDWPTTADFSSQDNNKYSIYATYTPGGDDYTMPVTVGSFTLTGIAAILTKALNIICSVGSFTLTGIAALLLRGYTIVVDLGEYTLTGITTNFLRPIRNMAVSVGEYTLTGIDTILSRLYSMVVDTGEYVLTGITTAFTKALNMGVEVGSFTLTGINTLLKRGYTIVVDLGEYTLTGIDTILTKGLNLLCSVGEYTLNGIDIILNRGYAMATESGEYILTGIDNILTRGINLITTTGEFILTGINVNLLRPIINMVVAVGEFTLTGIETILTKTLNLIVSAGSFVLTGIDVILTKGYGIICEMGEFVLTGININFLRPIRNMIVSVGEYTLTGIDIILSRLYNMLVETGEFILTGTDIILTKALNLIVSVGEYTLTGIDVILYKGGQIIMSVTTGIFELTGIDTIFQKALNIAVSTGEYVLTGVDNTITKGLHLAVEVGSYILTGISVNLLRPIRNMIVSVGKFILTGIDALFHGRGAWTWDNQGKNTSDWAGTTKHSVDWTNQNKT